jgi:hypothetical protein
MEVDIELLMFVPVVLIVSYCAVKCAVVVQECRERKKRMKEAEEDYENGITF